jgi:hypothetical protein
LILLVAGSAASAQTSKGFIVGNVTDPNGAAVSGATVRITNPATCAIGEGQESSTGYVTNAGAPINLSDARFLVDPRVRTGLAGRNILRGPRVSRLDLSLNKGFRLPFMGETTRFEVRADYFNVLNHPTFGPGTGDVLDPTFNDPRFNEGGISVGNVTGGRIGQMQLRLVF